jgi:hypothetical protein
MYSKRPVLFSNPVQIKKIKYIFLKVILPKISLGFRSDKRCGLSIRRSNENNGKIKFEWAEVDL